ncbi:hypothetical protein [Bradyrhizobium yuanmingense]|uniref:hypothetical protein n=2 Tax=Nitrobacteraceae TaxID=41294 RepID=UPI0023B9F095|nr:hypothetical protein [Bradyrhizobium yuanmingense]MDF0580821.1 hypothetical protein [Bradyrhizobium yuanmingense]
MTRDQQQGRKGNREHRGRQLAHVVHGILYPSTASGVERPAQAPRSRRQQNIAVFSRSRCDGIPAALKGTNGPLARCRLMNIEKRALLDHAERCRRVANDLTHSKAAQRLRAMADEYEARATRLDEDVRSTPSRNSRCQLEGKGERQG